MLQLGFTEFNRYFRHTDTEYFIEFPRGPLGVGDEPIDEVASLHFETGTLRLLSATDCVKDRLAAFIIIGEISKGLTKPYGLHVKTVLIWSRFVVGLKKRSH